MYPILYFNELNISNVEKKYTKTLDQLQSGDFKSADVRKMEPGSFYRARLDLKDRLLFTFIKYNDQNHLLLLEIIKNHNYAESRFLRGAMLPEDDKLLPVLEVSDLEEGNGSNLVFLHPKNKSVFFLNKFISFDSIQQSVLNIKPPLVIIGSAGTGKTALVLEKLKTLIGNVAYISLSGFLVENATKIYFSNGYFNEDQEVEFLSLIDYLNSWHKLNGTEVTFKLFEIWYNKHSNNIKIYEPYRVYEEFKGVISGTPTHVSYLSEKEYLELGVKQSIFSLDDRIKLYPLYLKYLDWIKENNYYDSNLICFEYLQYIKPRYDYIFVDEVQDITNIQLQSILKSLNNSQHFILTGDSNQIVHPNFFSWSKIKTYFYKSESTFKNIQILQTNYRNSPQVVKLSNDLLKIKNTRFGSIDKESNYLINSNATNEGEVIIYSDSDKKKAELNKRTQHSTSYAVIVSDNSLKGEAIRFFKTPLVFSVQEAKGLEYENVILLNFISHHSSEFDEIVRGVDKNDLLQEVLRFSRSANKNDKDAEIYKFYINSFYVAITRSIKNIYLFESKIQHPALLLLELVESRKDIEIAETKSSKEEWLEEARRLEEQGKYEQAEQIRAKYLGYDYISREDMEAMLPLAFDSTKKEHEVKKERKQVFQYASTHNQINWIEKLALLQFQRAKLYMKDVRQHRKEFTKNIRMGYFNETLKTLNKYGLNFCIEENVNAFHLALLHGQSKTIDYLLGNNFDVNQTDVKNRNGSNFLIEGFLKTTQLKHQFYATLQTLKQYWYRSKPTYLKYLLDEIKFIVGSNSMLYYLIIIMREKETTQKIKATHRHKIDAESTIQYGTFDMDDFEAICETMPDEVLPAYRKNRSYINSVLAAHEISKISSSKNSKATFIRVARGRYMLNPRIVWV